MTEEELKAIKHLKNYKYDNEVRQSIDIILNLIEKQQKEIENKYSRQEILERVKKLERFKEDLKVVDVILFIKREFLEE